MVDVTAFLTILIVFILSYVVRRATHRQFQYPSPRGIPFLGNIFEINLYRYTDVFEKWHKQLGDTIECFFMHFKFIDTVDPTIVSQVLHSSDRDDLYKYTLKDVMGNNSVIIIDGPVWKKQRRILQTNFTAHALQHMMKTKPQALVKPAKHMVERLKGVADTGMPAEMDLEFERVSLAVVGNAVFSYDFGYCESNFGDADTPFLKELWKGMDEYNKRMVDPLRKYINPYSIWRFSRTMRIIKDLVYEKVHDRMRCQNLNSQGVMYDDCMGLMLTAKEKEDDTEPALSYPEVIDNVVTLLLAGHETTGHALSFTCFEVASNPHVEKQLLEALDSIGDREITYDDLQGDGELKYVGWIVQEALRVHPVAASILRKWHTGQQLGKDKAAGEYNVGVTLPMLHKDERIWPNPEVFDPTRFDEDKEDYKNRPVTAYLPFGGGPRTCIGKKLALLELKFMLATMYRNYVFRLVPDFKYDVEITVTMHEIHGMPLLVQSRR